MSRIASLLALLVVGCAGAHRQPSDVPRGDGLPAWVSQVGARSRPTAARVCSANAHGAVGDGVTKSTAAIQRAIDDCSAAGGGTVRLDAGRYVTGAIFLK